MKTKLLIVMLMVLLIPQFTEASTTYTNGQNFTISRECFYEGYNCGTTYTCDMSVYDPEGLVIVNNQSMTNEGSHFAYPMDAQSTNGEYRVRMSCTDGSNSGSEIFYFNITNTGDEEGIWIFLILGLLSFMLLILGLFMKNYHITGISGAVFTVTGMYVMIYGLKFVSNLYTRSIAFVFLGLGVFFLVVAGMKVIDNKEEDEF